MKRILSTIAIITFIFGTFFIFKGFDKKNNYRESGYSSNAYVGGDAYNYIINSNYFTGYNVLGIGCYIMTVLSLTGAAILKSLEDRQEQEKQFYDYIREHPMLKNSGKKSANNVKQRDEGFSLDEWGKLPNISDENNNHGNSSQATNTNTSESPKSQVSYNSNQNIHQSQNPQYYSYPPQPMSNEQWAHPISQNMENNPHTPNFNIRKIPGNMSLQNSQNNNSRLQDNNTNMPLKNDTEEEHRWKM